MGGGGLHVEMNSRLLLFGLICLIRQESIRSSESVRLNCSYTQHSCIKTDYSRKTQSPSAKRGHSCSHHIIIISSICQFSVIVLPHYHITFCCILFSNLFHLTNRQQICIRVPPQTHVHTLVLPVWTLRGPAMCVLHVCDNESC